MNTTPFNYILKDYDNIDIILTPYEYNNTKIIYNHLSQTEFQTNITQFKNIWSTPIFNVEDVYQIDLNYFYNNNENWIEII